MATLDLGEVISRERIVAAASLAVTLPHPPARFFHHGWQSWSLTTWTAAGERLPPLRPRLIDPMQIDPAYARHSLPHGSWVGAVDTGTGVLLVGSLGTDAHVELRDGRLHGWYEAGTGDWFAAHGSEQAVFARYAALLGERLGTGRRGIPPRVWSSWYSFYTSVDEQLLQRTLKQMADLPFDVVQVDDGWEAAVGDWEANAKFPSGMADLALRVRATGRKAGLWLAPLIALRSSALFRRHPDWFLRDAGGRLVSAGFNWGERVYALDTANPDVLLWLAGLMKRVRGWGFDYLKLDFLHAGALPGKRAGDLPREAAYRAALKVMRDVLGSDAYLLACGAPIIPSLGLCDGLRIGGDVAAEWENARDALLLGNPTRPGVRNAIRTTVHRLWLGSIVQVDPDAVFFRTRECTLDCGQKRLLQNLALVCRFRGTSDPPWWLTAAEREDLRAFLGDLPPVEQGDGARFRVGLREVDFSPSLPLPAVPRGLAGMAGAILGWVGNLPLAMAIFHAASMGALKKMRLRAD
jgi:alpha-galactosidase